MALSALGEMAGLGFTGGALSLLVSVYVGLEGPALRIAALTRRGWRQWGVVEASGRDEAEIRYIAGTAPEQAVRETVVQAPQPQLGRPAASGPALGLFSYPGKP